MGLAKGLNCDLLKNCLAYLTKMCAFVEKPAETLRLVSHLVRAPNSRSGGHEFESPVRQELSSLTKSGKTVGSGLSTLVTLTWCLSTWLAWSHDHVSLSGCVTLAAWHVTDRLTCPADLLDRRHFSTPTCSNPTRYWRELCREACRDAQTSIG